MKGRVLRVVEWIMFVFILSLCLGQAVLLGLLLLENPWVMEVSMKLNAELKGFSEMLHDNVFLGLLLLFLLTLAMNICNGIHRFLRMKRGAGKGVQEKLLCVSKGLAAVVCILSFFGYQIG